MDLSKREYINCPLCQANHPQNKYKIDSWNIVKCKNCDFIYVNPRLEKNELLNIYSSNYFDNDTVGYVHYRESRELRTKNFRRWVDDALPYYNVAVPCNALDIGCAAGYCLEVFKSKDWNAFGVELDREYADLLKQSGNRIYNAPLLDISFEERYDIITMFDVIEHLADLQENFAKLHSILNDNGSIVMITPDYNSLQRKLLGKKWFQFKPIEHINYFSLAAIEKLAAKTGFKVVAHKKAGQYSDIAFLADRLRKYKFGAFLPLFRLIVKIAGLENKHLYVDTASLYLVLKKS